jgi:hypothetical protein
MYYWFRSFQERRARRRGEKENTPQTFCALSSLGGSQTPRCMVRAFVGIDRPLDLIIDRAFDNSSEGRVSELRVKLTRIPEFAN